MALALVALAVVVQRAGMENVYVRTPFIPVGHPNSGLVCGTKRWRSVPLVWLLTQEETLYEKGERIFELTGGSRQTKLKIQ